MSLQTNPATTAQRQEARLTLQTAMMSLLPVDKQQWLSDQLALVAIERSNRSVDLAFGLCPRRLGNSEIRLSSLQQSQMARHMPGWQLEGMTMDVMARILVLSCFEDATQLAEQVGRLLRHADLKEQLAIYRGLPLYPASAMLNDRLADGLRSNMNQVFDAIAHGNPYPAWHLDTHRFNHMVLKAIFIESTLESIVGLDVRNNSELVRMLLDFARERRAASRAISSELWSAAIPFMSSEELQEFNLEKAS